MDTNIGLLLKKRAEITPQNEAFVEFERDRRFTYAELNQRCNRIADGLLAQGIEPGDRVAHLAENGYAWIVTDLAINWLREQREQGLIARFGASVETVEEGLICLEQEGLTSLQVIFNIFRQRPADLFFAEAKRRQVGILARVPLSSR